MVQTTHKTFPLRGVAQIALVVEDLNRSVEAYSTRFGVGPWHFYTYGKPLVKPSRTSATCVSN